MLELWSKPVAAQPCVQRTRMPLVVTEDKALGPIDGGLLRAVGILPEPRCIATLVEQLLGAFCNATLQKPRLAQRADLGYRYADYGFFWNLSSQSPSGAAYAEKLCRSICYGHC